MSGGGGRVGGQFRETGEAVEEFLKTKKYLRGLLCENCGKWLWLHALVRGSTLVDANFIFQLKKKI